MYFFLSTLSIVRRYNFIFFSHCRVSTNRRSTDASVILHAKSVQIAANDLSALNKRIEIPFNGEREKTENENKRHCRKRGKSKTVKCAECVATRDAGENVNTNKISHLHRLAAFGGVLRVCNGRQTQTYAQ